MDGADDAVARRADGEFHLHRLEDDERVAHRNPHAGPSDDAHDRGWHRSPETLVSASLRPVALTGAVHVNLEEFAAEGDPDDIAFGGGAAFKGLVGRGHLMSDAPKPWSGLTHLEGRRDSIEGDGGTGHGGHPVALALTHENAGRHDAPTRPSGPVCSTDRTPACRLFRSARARVRASPAQPRLPPMRLEGRPPGPA